MNLYKIVALVVLLLTASVVIGQESDVVFGETVILTFEETYVSIPVGWIYEMDDDTGFLILEGEDDNLQIQISASLQVDDRLDMDFDIGVADAMVETYAGLFELDIDADDVEVEELTDTITLGILEFTEDNVSILVKNTEIEQLFFLDVYNTLEEELTEEQGEFVIAIILSLSDSMDDGDALVQLCAISVETDNTVSLRVGPGTNRTVIAFLPAGNYNALGQEVADDETQWFKLDKDEVELALARDDTKT